MRVETDEPEIVERIAALDVGKAEVVCCARVPGPGARRMQEVRTVSTMTAALLGLGGWLAELGVSRVVMEATSDYWRAPFYLLEDRFETWLVNAHDVKPVPGRPKTDRLDAVWLCKVAERQMLRPSFVPPPAIRQLRDLTRYRVDLLAVRTAEKQRIEKLLEDALIKISVVVSDPFGVSGRAILAALIAGERDPAVLAEFGPRTAAGQDRSADRGADRPVHRPPRVPAGADVAADRRHHRRHRHRAGAHRGPTRRAGTRGRPARRHTGSRAGRRADDPGRDRHRHGPLPDPGASDLLGAVRTCSQRVRRPEEGQRRHRQRQSLPGASGGRGRGQRRPHRHLSR